MAGVLRSREKSQKQRIPANAMALQSLRLLPRQLPRRRRRLLVPPPRIQDLERAPDGGHLRTPGRRPARQQLRPGVGGQDGCHGAQEEVDGNLRRLGSDGKPPLGDEGGRCGVMRAKGKGARRTAQTTKDHGTAQHSTQWSRTDFSSKADSMIPFREARIRSPRTGPPSLGMVAMDSEQVVQTRDV
ncbi:hypothetical protein CTA2_5584 [Colletotrichum tanaceti]|nr:hypothetical protein CTA2_5584 [Colletotrichum tanaceti]